MRRQRRAGAGMLYGRRKGPKLSAHQERLLETLLPQLRLNLQAGSPIRRNYFAARGSSDVWLEIGFGAGEHLLWQAEHHPDVGLIGAEPYISGIAKLLSKTWPHRSGGGPNRNIRIHDDDARDIIEALPDACTRPRLHPLSRSVAQDTASQAPLRSDEHARRARARDETRRGTSLCERRCRLRRLDARAPAGASGVRMDGDARAGLARRVRADWPPTRDTKRKRCTVRQLISSFRRTL